MQVTEENFEKVAEIIGHLSEFLIKVHGTTSYRQINLKERISMAQLGLDALEEYRKDLLEACRDTKSEESVIGF